MFICGKPQPKLSRYAIQYSIGILSFFLVIHDRTQALLRQTETALTTTEALSSVLAFDRFDPSLREADGLRGLREQGWRADGVETKKFVQFTRSSSLGPNQFGPGKIGLLAS